VPFGDASIELRRDLADESACKPAILPKSSLSSISDENIGRGEEEGLLQGAALASDRSLVTSRAISFYFPFLVKKILSDITIFRKFCM
jgi:hypothetical protein